MLLGYYMQMLAAFLLLSATHYFAAAFLPVSDCDETYNFVEPMHFVLYGRGMQTWENCPQYALRSWLLVWIYAWPASLIRGVESLPNLDVYYYLRIFHGRVACLPELFFVYSVWNTFSGKAAFVALLLLLLNYPIPHAAVSVLPTSFVMCCYFVALGCWLRTQPRVPRAGKGGVVQSPVATPLALVFSTVFLVVVACVVGWAFAGLIAVPIGLDLLLRFPRCASLSLFISLAVVCGAAFVVDLYYYCRPTLSAFNLVRYNVAGGEGRGPSLYGTEPWYFFLKNLLLNFHVLFLAGMAAPLVVLCKRRPIRPAAATDGVDYASGLGVTRGRQLLYMSPFFLWLGFWFWVPHKEERFMSPAYPFLLLSATLALTHAFFDGSAPRLRGRVKLLPVAARVAAASRPIEVKHRLGSRRRIAFVVGCTFMIILGFLSFSRAMGIYHYYAAPQRLFYDWAPLLREVARAKVAAQNTSSSAMTVAPFTLCVGKEWYRFPSSFFLDQQYARYAFLRTRSFSGILPVPFVVPPGGHMGLLNRGQSGQQRVYFSSMKNATSCACGSAAMNDRNEAIPAQYVTSARDECDAIFDSLPPLPQHGSFVETQTEEDELHLGHFRYSMLSLRRLRRIVEGADGNGFRSVATQYAIIDAARTPMWCRVLYYPFGISNRCAVWRPLVLRSASTVDVAGDSLPHLSENATVWGKG